MSDPIVTNIDRSYFIDLAYKSPRDFDENLHDLLGPSDDSGEGWGLRDHQWHNIPSDKYDNPTKLLEEIKQAVPEDRLAYVSMNIETPVDEHGDPIEDFDEEDDPRINYEAPWLDAFNEAIRQQINTRKE